MAKGKFIVIDGTDGSGKKTQTDLLGERLKREGREVFIVDFPRYGKPSAYFVEQYLNGKFGSLEEIGPYEASLFYALDRYEASFEIRKKLDEGAIVLANRFTSSNMGHQGGKIAHQRKRKELMMWLLDLEFGKLKIPEPDITLVLHVDAEAGQTLVDGKGHREYVGGARRDLHEENSEHLKSAERVYLEIAKLPGFKLIECMRDGVIMTREEIHQLVWREVVSILS